GRAAGEGGHREPVDPVRASRERRPVQREHPEQLPERERQHQEVDAARAHGEEPREERHAGRRRECNRELSECVRRGVLGEQPCGVPADAEVAGLAERRKPRISEQQVDARGEEPEDEDLGEQERAVVVEDRRGGDEQRERREPHDEPVPGHLPNSPCGRAIRIRAIAAKSANGAACGRPCCWPSATPSDCACPMISEATNAPVIEPSPPTTTTMSASSSTSSPTPGVTCSIGPPMTPATVAGAEAASGTADG